MIKTRKLPISIWAYMIYELTYILFWIISPKLNNFALGQSIIFYAITSVVAVFWIGYMCIRALVHHDENVHLPFIITNIVAIFVIARI